MSTYVYVFQSTYVDSVRFSVHTRVRNARSHAISNNRDADLYDTAKSLGLIRAYESLGYYLKVFKKKRARVISRLDNKSGSRIGDRIRFVRLVTYSHAVLDC